MNKFAYIKEDVKSLDNIWVEKDDVGIIIESESNKGDILFIVRLWKNVKLNLDDFEVFNVIESGDGYPDKICNLCHKLLPTTNFAKNQNGINNRTVRRPSCQDCRKELEGADVTTQEKRIWAKKKPNKEPFECPICNKRTIAGVTCKVVLDHSHKTGKVRGYVCDSCNTGIGRFKDDIELLKKAIKHLE